MGSFIKSLGYYVPKNVVKNEDLIKHMDTTDEWIQERTGIQERRYATRHEESTVSWQPMQAVWPSSGLE